MPVRTRGRLAWPSTARSFRGPSTTREGLAGLKPAFAALADYPLDEEGTTYRIADQPEVSRTSKIEHIHHAGNSSGVVDGSAAVLLASKAYAEGHGLEPRARVVAMANMGDCPTLMLNAPVPAARKVLAKAGLTLDDIDLFEINEAFAVVAEKFIRDLGLDRDKVNVNGGAMALGHPIGATGAMLIGTMVDELERRDLKRGLVTMCAAGGMAPAIIIERVLTATEPPRGAGGDRADRRSLLGRHAGDVGAPVGEQAAGIFRRIGDVLVAEPEDAEGVHRRRAVIAPASDAAAAVLRIGGEAVIGRAADARQVDRPGCRRWAWRSCRCWARWWDRPP